MMDIVYHMIDRGHLINHRYWINSVYIVVPLN